MRAKFLRPVTLVFTAILDRRHRRRDVQPTPPPLGARPLLYAGSAVLRRARGVADGQGLPRTDGRDPRRMMVGCHSRTTAPPRSSPSPSSACSRSSCAGSSSPRASTGRRAGWTPRDARELGLLTGHRRPSTEPGRRAVARGSPRPASARRHRCAGDGRFDVLVFTQDADRARELLGRPTRAPPALHRRRVGLDPLDVGAERAQLLLEAHVARGRCGAPRPPR